MLGENTSPVIDSQWETDVGLWVKWWCKKGGLSLEKKWAKTFILRAISKAIADLAGGEGIGVSKKVANTWFQNWVEGRGNLPFTEFWRVMERINTRARERRGDCEIVKTKSSVLSLGKKFEEPWWEGWVSLVGCTIEGVVGVDLEGEWGDVVKGVRADNTKDSYNSMMREADRRVRKATGKPLWPICSEADLLVKLLVITASNWSPGGDGHTESWLISLRSALGYFLKAVGKNLLLEMPRIKALWEAKLRVSKNSKKRKKSSKGG